MYSLLVLVHVVGVAFRLQGERNLERVRALLELSTASYPAMYGSLLVLLLAGIILGLLGNWWGHAWIWVSLILLIAMLIFMRGFGSRIYGEVRKAVGLPYYDKGKLHPPIEPASAEAINAALAKGRPTLLTVIGFGGIAVIAWLMMFKPL